MATAEEPDFTRFRVVTEQGILAVFDADEEWDGRDEPYSQLAYWNDFATQQLFFFDQLLFTDADVLQSIVTMPRDLTIDLAPILVEKPEFDPLPEITSPGLWIPAAEAYVLSVMTGGAAPAAESGGVSGLASPCVPTGLCDPALAAAASGPLAAPIRGTSRSELFALAAAGTRCDCDHHGECSPPCANGEDCYDGDPCTTLDRITCIGLCTPRCHGTPSSGNSCADDGDACTSDVCSVGQCTHPPLCEDNDPCTKNVCTGGACTYPPKCDDENECTEDSCDGGVCTYDPAPREGASCEGDDNECTYDVCRDGGCSPETHGCTSASDCPPSDSLCVLPPTCEACGCRYSRKCNDGDPCSTDICHRQSGMCEFLDFATVLPPEELCDTYGCVISMTGLPEALLLNDDDDNGNGIADYVEVDPVANENDNDLVQITLSSLGCYPADGAGGIPSSSCPGHYTGLPDHWRTVARPSAVGTYLNTDREPYVWPGYSTDWPPPSTLYVDGGQAPSSCPQGWEFRLVYNDPPGYYCRWRSPTVGVVKIASLTWEKVPNSGNADLEENAPNNGGIRMFPDWLSPSDNPSPPDKRQQVNLVATIIPPKSGVTVYFKVFDVDDPFDQINSTMPSVSLLDSTPATGPDNRVPVGQADPALVALSPATTDSNGKATKTITVSMQPGNNYRAAASLFQAALTQPTTYGGQTVDPQQHADALNAVGGSWSGYSTPLTWSQMLTVWRRLWIERDTMAAPNPVDLRLVAIITGIYPTPNRPGLTTVEIGNFLTNSPGSDLNNYEEGLIVFNNCPSGSDQFSVVESLRGEVKAGIEDKIIVFGMPGACAAVSTGVTISDDDDLSVLGTALAPHFPNGGQFLLDAYAPAYILPIHPSADYEDVVPFEDYLSATEIDLGLGSWNDQRELFSSTDFWASFIVGAWEGAADLEIDRNSDGDPDLCFTLLNPPLPRAGAESPVTGSTDRPEGVSVIFFQAIEDDAACTAQTDEPHTMVHEVGHSCGDLGHKDNTIMEEGAPKNQNNFDADQLRIFRSQNPW